MSVVTVAPEEKAAVSRRILEALPEWFGVADAREAYIREAADLPMAGAKDSAGLIVGFATHRRQTEAAIELPLIAVLPAHHRQGHGRPW